MTHGNILALDFAWRNTGWVAIDPDGKPISWGVIKTNQREKKNKSDVNPLADISTERLNYKYIKLKIEQIKRDIIKEPPHYVKLIAEVPYFSQSSQSARLIGMGWSLLNQLDAEFLIGGDVKEILTGNRQAPKTEIATYIQDHGGLRLMMEKDHIKDAYATYLAWRSKPYRLNKQLSK